MIIQVLMRDVGCHGHVEIDGINPVLGQTMVVTGSSTAANSGATFWVGAPATDPYHLPGGGLVFLDQVFLLVSALPAASSWSWPIPIPNDVNLLGLRAAGQMLVLGTNAPIGVDFSNGVVWVAGR